MNPSEVARTAFELCGVLNPAELSLEDLIAYHEGEVRDVDLKNCDGRVVMKGGKAIVSVSTGIIYPQKRRFVLVHELGHMLLHAGKEAVFTDDDQTLEDYRRGSQEREANTFAAELLMPGELFKKACFKKKFSSATLRDLANLFCTSITATIYRFLEYGNHPICVVYSRDGVIQYSIKSKDFNHFMPDNWGLPVPNDSVANEYYTQQRIHSKEHSDQEIFKSTWFRIREWDTDSKMYEYCLVSNTLNSVLSVIWER